MLAAAASYLVAGFLDFHIMTEPADSVSLGFQAPQYLLVTIAEILVSVTGLSFAFQCAPADMKSLVTALLMLSSAIGDIITGAFYSIFASLGMERWMMFFAFSATVVLNGLVLLWVKSRFGKLLEL
jgi:dipeptide/tripeptide permease